jgi:hypothetical protein
MSMGLVLGLASHAWAKPSAKDVKVNAYVEIINAWSNHVYDNRDRYAKWVADMQAGPTCKERDISSPSSIGESARDDFKAYRKAIAKAPKLEADEAALQMVTALEELMKPVSEASVYYHGNKYRQDGCKRGKELHPIILAGWSKFIQGDRAVRAFVEKYNDERQATELADAAKKYGKKLHYHHLKLAMDGKALVRAVDVVRATPKPDLLPLRGVLATFQQTLTDTKALVDKEKGGKNADALYQGGYEQMVKTAESYKEAVDQLIKAIEAEAKAPPKPAPKSTSKTPPKPQATSPGERERAGAQVIDAYNRMVDEANKTTFSTGMK